MISVNNMISFYGSNCLECQIFKATQDDDPEVKQKIATTWSAISDTLIKPEDISCDGCKAGKTYFGKCQECLIRVCGEKKKVETCGHCDEYPCNKLHDRLSFEPSNKEILDNIHKSLNT